MKAVFGAFKVTIVVVAVAALRWLAYLPILR